MRKTIFIVIGLAVILIVYIGYTLGYRESPNSPNKGSVPLFTLATTTNAATIPQGWQEYRNDAYSVSFFHPQDLVVKEYSEGGGAMTITFQNIDNATGFQLFVLPYNEPQVSEERFRQDIPSGVRTDLKEITLDDIRGVSFYSEQDFLGETREIWLIRNGFLYEITTPRSLGEWIEPIMKTWTFIE